MRSLVGLFVVLVLVRASDADDLIYVEALGKAGAYGVGYERELASSRVSAGVAASFMVIEDQQVATVAPYLHLRLLGARRHRLFGELGVMLAHSRIPSPVADWDGSTDTGAGGFLGLGYEYARRRIVMRASGAVVAGEGGLGPMLGIALGLRP